MAQALPSYTYNSWVMVSIPVELPYGNKNDNNKGTVYGVLLMYHLLCVCGGGFPGGSDGRESACNAGDLGSVPR